MYLVHAPQDAAVNTNALHKFDTGLAAVMGRMYKLSVVTVLNANAPEPILSPVATSPEVVASPKPVTKKFVAPKVDGWSLDYCREFATDCGWPAVTYFCQMRG